MSAGAALLGLSLLLALPAHAQMYKCVDGRGVTQYSDKPCAAGKGGEVNIRGQPPISGKLHDSSDTEAAEREFRRRQSQRERERQDESRIAEERKRRCAQLRAQHNTWTSVNRVAVTNEMGERRYLEDAEREARKAQLEAAIARECG